jgi:manganese/iron transport system substrate-binding protein
MVVIRWSWMSQLIERAGMKEIEISSFTRRQALLVGLLVPFSAFPTRANPRLKVATSFTIIADMARQVAGDAADVISITEPGAEIHGYEPTPGDLVKVQDAGLIFWNGLNLEVWFERFFAGLNSVPDAVLTEGITPIAISTGPYSGRPNPHSWMSPRNGLIYVENIRKALVAADPANAAIYTANAATYSATIKALDAPLRAGFANIPQAQRWLVTSEGAFSYLAADYGFREAFIWPINADRQGSPQQLRRVIDIVRQENIPVIFSESTVSDKPARRIAAETGARYGGVLYVDQLSAPDGPVPSYLKLLDITTRTIMEGFVAG